MFLLYFLLLRAGSSLSVCSQLLAGAAVVLLHQKVALYEIHSGLIPLVRPGSWNQWKQTSWSHFTFRRSGLLDFPSSRQCYCYRLSHTSFLTLYRVANVTGRKKTWLKRAETPRKMMEVCCYVTFLLQKYILFGECFTTRDKRSKCWSPESLMMCSPSIILHTETPTVTTENKASQTKKINWNLPNDRGELGAHQSTFSPNSKRLHYRHSLPRDRSSQPTAITAHLLHLHVSLIMGRVYSLEDQLPTEMAGCVIKSLTLGAPKM